MEREMDRLASVWHVHWEENWCTPDGVRFRSDLHDEHIVATSYKSLLNFLVNRCAYYTDKARESFEQSFLLDAELDLPKQGTAAMLARGLCSLGEITFLKKGKLVTLGVD